MGTNKPLTKPEVWLYEDNNGSFCINNDQLSEVKFSSAREREQWLEFFPDVIRHKGKPPTNRWWEPTPKKV